MKIVHTVPDLRVERRAARAAGRTVALVPTMGALHAGHLTLIRRAAALCDDVVVSVFVNPAQFDRPDDLAAYPRDLERDALLAGEAGATIVFAPSVAEVYPDGFAAQVRVGGPLVEALEGAHRGAAHFPGVTTVVTKLLHMVAPDRVLFGQKDAQQCLVVAKLIADLDMDVAMEIVPTVREADGLALSSRNVRLQGADREQALALKAALDAAADAVAAGERVAAAILDAGRAAMAPFGIQPEYLALVDERTLAPVQRLEGRALLAVAAPVGPVRLIDNAFLSPVPASAPTPTSRRPSVQRTMLKSKIHRATITDSDLHYVGSITVDPDLLEAADVREHEQVHVVDVDNGARFETYTIAGQRGSGEMKVNGAAARLVHTGDTIIVISYAQYDEAALEAYEPRVVHVERGTNRIVTVDDAVSQLLTGEEAA